MTILKSQDELNFDEFERFCLEEGYVNIDTLNKYRKLLLKNNMSIEEVYKHNVKTKKNIRGFGYVFNNTYKAFSDLLEINDLYEPSMEEKDLLHDVLGTIVPNHITWFQNSHVGIRVVDPNLVNKIKRLRTSTIKYIDVELTYDFIKIATLINRHSLLVNLNYQLVDQIKREFEVKKESCVNINRQLELLTQRLLYRYGKLIDVKQIDSLIDLEYIVNRVIPENPFFKEMVIFNVKNELKITNIFIDTPSINSIKVENVTVKNRIPLGGFRSSLLEEPFFTVVNDNHPKENYMAKINPEEFEKQQKEIELSIENKFLEKVLEILNSKTPQHQIPLNHLFDLVLTEYCPEQLVTLSFSSYEYIEKILKTLYSKYDYNLVVKKSNGGIFIYTSNQSIYDEEIEKITSPVNLQLLEVDKLYMFDRSSDTTKANNETPIEYETYPIGWNPNLARQQAMYQQPSNPQFPFWNQPHFLVQSPEMQPQLIPWYQYEELLVNYKTLNKENHKLVSENKKLESELMKLKHIIEYLEEKIKGVK